MKLFFIFFSLFCLLNADTKKLDKEITLTKKEIETKKDAIKSASLTMEELGKSIVIEQKNLEELSKKLYTLSDSIEKNRETLRESEKKYDELEKRKNEAMDKKQELERNLVDIIVKDLAYSQIVSSKNEIGNEKDVISQEIFKSLNKIVLEQSKKLKDDYIEYKEKTQLLEHELALLKNEIDELKDSKKEVIKLKKREQRYLNKLNAEKTLYKKKIKKLMDEQESSRSLLDNLKITKNKTIRQERERAKEEARRAKERQEKLAKKDETQEQLFEEADKIKIRHIGSSYQETKNIHYRGNKVEAPMEKFEVIKKFGPYMDPVYNIKIHNDSVTLKSSKKDVIVRNVMDGKVIFAKDFNMLGNTVIIKHDNNMHTIYSNLSKIAPDIKPGKNIRSRAAIGRVDDELKFEVTKDEVPIDPFDLIGS